MEFSPELGGLVLAARRGSRTGGFYVTVDDALLAEIDRARQPEEPAPAPAPASARTQVASRLSPREIQARLRAGRSIEEVAAEAGVSTEWVDRWAAPVLAEQAAAVARAGQSVLHTPRRGPSDRPLEASVIRNLAERGVSLGTEEMQAAWSARHLADTDWLITFRFRNRGRPMAAEWMVNLANGALTARNRLAAELGFIEPGRRPMAPIPPLAPAAGAETARSARAASRTAKAAKVKRAVQAAKSARSPKAVPKVTKATTTVKAVPRPAKATKATNGGPAVIKGIKAVKPTEAAKPIKPAKPAKATKAGGPGKVSDVKKPIEAVRPPGEAPPAVSGPPRVAAAPVSSPVRTASVSQPPAAPLPPRVGAHFASEPTAPLSPAAGGAERPAPPAGVPTRENPVARFPTPPSGARPPATGPTTEGPSAPIIRAFPAGGGGEEPTPAASTERPSGDAPPRRERPLRATRLGPPLAARPAPGESDGTDPPDRGGLRPGNQG